MDGGLPALGSAQHRPKSTTTTSTIAVPPWVAAPRGPPVLAAPLRPPRLLGWAQCLGEGFTR